MTLMIMRCDQTEKTCSYVKEGKKCAHRNFHLHMGIASVLETGPTGLIHGLGASYRPGKTVYTRKTKFFRDLHTKRDCMFFGRCVRLYAKILKQRIESFKETNGRYPTVEERTFESMALLLPDEVDQIKDLGEWCRGAEHLYFF